MSLRSATACAPKLPQRREEIRLPPPLAEGTRAILVQNGETIGTELCAKGTSHVRVYTSAPSAHFQTGLTLILCPSTSKLSSCK